MTWNVKALEVLYGFGLKQYKVYCSQLTVRSRTKKNMKILSLCFFVNVALGKTIKPLHLRAPTSLTLSQAYTSKRRILIQVLPVPNAYTKSANACIGKMNICITRFGIRIGDRKYLNEYTPFGSVSLCIKLPDPCVDSFVTFNSEF